MPDEITDKPKCQHADVPECGCGCHAPDSRMRHIVACCSECPVCGKRIPQSAWRNAEVGEGIAHWDPMLISLVRRSMPDLIATDICGVQPTCAPSGLIFAMGAKAKAISDGTYVPLPTDKRKFSYRPRIERNIKIMRETTTGPIVYEVEVEGKRIRRLAGTHDPTARQGQDGAWKPFATMNKITIGQPVLIGWRLNELNVLQSTLTSDVQSIDAYDGSVGL